MPAHSEARARLFGAVALVLLGVWILHGFLVPFAWAVILAIATWPLYQRLHRALGSRAGSIVPGLILTLLVGSLLLGPITYGLLQLGNEMQSFVQTLRDAQRDGIPPPAWLTHLPRVGAWVGQTWAEWLGSSDAVRESLRYLASSEVLSYTRSFAAQVLHRYAAAFFTIVTIFFVYRDGERIGQQVLLLCDRMFGGGGSHYARHAVSAVRATVNGIVLVALGQGVALGFGYGIAGLQHATLLGAITGVVAFIPFAAKLMFLGAALSLFAAGQTVAGVGLIVYGLLVILAADNYVRPALIGGAVKLPFLWTLLGILGGIETFGLLGLFLGPTVMAILMSVWRDGVAISVAATNDDNSR